MNPRVLLPGSAALALLLAPAAVSADQTPTADSGVEVKSGIETVPGVGSVMINAPVLVNLSDGAAAEPISVGLDAWYGLSADLSVGVVHSPFGVSGFYGGALGGFCVVGESNGCPDHVYNNLGVDARYAVYRTEMVTAAANVAILARNFDPVQIAAKAGGVVRVTPTSMVAIDFAPSVFVGVTKRDSANGNKEVLNLPVTAHLMPNEMLDFFVQSGVATPFENAGDQYTIPLSLGASAWFTSNFGATAVFSAPQVVAGDDLDLNGMVDPFDVRTLTLAINYRGDLIP